VPSVGVEEEAVEGGVEAEEAKLNMVYEFRRNESPRRRSNPDPSKFESAEYPTIPPAQTVMRSPCDVWKVWKMVLESRGWIGMACPPMVMTNLGGS